MRYSLLLVAALALSAVGCNGKPAPVPTPSSIVGFDSASACHGRGPVRTAVRAVARVASAPFRLLFGHHCN